MSLTKISNQSLSAVTTLPSAIPTGALTLISTQTASSSASISFTSGIDSTYDSYIFKFINIHPSANGQFSFNLSTDSGSNYDVTKTTTFFAPVHAENDSEATLGYKSSYDIAQGTGFQSLDLSTNTDNDSSLSGTLQLFNPSSTTFVKHFISNTQHMHGNAYSVSPFVAGYGNTINAVDAVQFKMSSGNIDAGVIKL